MGHNFALIFNLVNRSFENSSSLESKLKLVLLGKIPVSFVKLYIHNVTNVII